MPLSKLGMICHDMSWIVCVILAFLSQNVLGELEKRSKDDKKKYGTFFTWSD